MPTQDEQDYQDYQDYLAYQQHLNGQKEAPPEPSLTGGSVRGLVDLIRPGFTQGAGHGLANAATLGNVDTKGASDDDLGYSAGKLGGTAAVAAAGGGLASAPASALGRIGAQTAVSGAQGFLQKPEGEDTLSNRTMNGGFSAILGGLLQSGGEGLSKLLGKGASISNDIKDVKSGEMANRAASAIDDAAAGIDAKQIDPRDAL